MSEIIVTLGDIETTGLDAQKGHRIIEVALSVWAVDKTTRARRQLARPYIQRINPERDIDPGAQAVHKISLSDLRGKPKWKDVAPIVSKILDKTGVFVAHNGMGFDGPFLALELVRLGYSVPNFIVHDTMIEGKLATGMGKAPNLGELAYACGIDYDPDEAHSALYDTRILEQCYWYGVDHGLFCSPVDLL